MASYGSPAPAEEGAAAAMAAEQQRYEELLCAPDAIMDIRVGETMAKYLKAGGRPERVIRDLADSYRGFAPMCDLVMGWLQLAGASEEEVSGIVDNYFRETTIQSFSTEKADSIFRSSTRSAKWLDQMIAQKTWRSLIYRLSELHPDSNLLKMAIKKIADIGFEGEIASVASAGSDGALYARVLGDTVVNILDITDEELPDALPTLVKLACQSEHAFLCAMDLLSHLQRAHRNGRRVKRIAQCVMEGARQAGASDAFVRTTALLFAGATRYHDVAAAIGSILSTKLASPADVSTLFQNYATLSQSKPPPPAELLRLPGVFDALIESVFDPRKTINPNFKDRYFRVLATASIYYDLEEAGQTHADARRGEEHRRSLVGKIDATEAAVAEAHRLVNVLALDWAQNPALIRQLYPLLAHPVVAMGLLRWVDVALRDPAVLTSTVNETNNAPFFSLIDEAGRLHARVRPECLSLVATLHEREKDVGADIAPKLRYALADRLLSLVWAGHVMPVLRWVASTAAARKMDAGTLRYFITEVLAMAEGSFSAPFASLVLSLLESLDAVETIVEGSDVGQSAAAFVDACEADRLGTVLSPHSAGVLTNLHRRLCGNMDLF